MRSKILIVPTLALGLAGGFGPSGVAIGAAGDAATTVTIQAQGVDLSGTVSSPKPKRCAAGRHVVVFKQVGTRGGGDDTKFASDNAQKNGNVYQWDTGNTGVAGKFYAVVHHITGCKGELEPDDQGRPQPLIDGVNPGRARRTRGRAGGVRRRAGPAPSRCGTRPSRRARH